MPIRPENKARYPKDWKEISIAIRERAGQKCEQCFAPNREIIGRGTGVAAGTYMVANGDVFDAETGEALGRARGSEYPCNYVHVILTVAHLDHQPENCDPSNLRAWCQRCHNAYDALERRRGIKARSRAQLAAGELF